MTEKSLAKPPKGDEFNFAPVDCDHFSTRLSREANSLPTKESEKSKPDEQLAFGGKPEFIKPIATEMPLPAGQKPDGDKKTDADKNRSGGGDTIIGRGGSKKIESPMPLPDIYLEIDSAIDKATKNSKTSQVGVKVADGGAAKGATNPERAGAAKGPDTIPGAVKNAEVPQEKKAEAAPDKAKPAIKEGDGSVLVNGVAADSTAAERHVKTVTNKDGTFVRDEKNRIISSESPDGKLKRTFEYGDPKFPDRVTTMTENGKTYKIIGPITYAQDGSEHKKGDTVKRDGLEMFSWSIYGDNKNLSEGNWYGNRSVSSEGVYTELDNDKGNIKLQDGTGKELTKEQADLRNKDGIWPSKINIERPDGSTIEASLTGKVVDSLKEKRIEGGKEKTVTWTKDGDSWKSDESPARARTAVSLKTNGDLAYTESDSTQKVESKNSDLYVTKNGVKDTFDRYGERTKVETADGARDLKYTKDAKGVATLSEITTTTGETKSTWTRKGNTDEWTSGDKSEIRKDLKVLADGSLQFTDKDGKRVKDTTSLERINYNAKDLPELVTFPSGATRQFTYDAQGLSKWVDHIPTKDGAKTDLTWERDTDGSFISKRENDKVYRREKVSVTDDADVKYEGTDKKPHESKARDIDRIARGEFVLSSESIVEARDRLVDAVKSSGINEERFNKWIKEFEASATADKVAPERIVKTFNNFADILTFKGESPNFDKDQLKTIVETGMHNITKYLEIDQGSHPTCNVTSVEVVAGRKFPDEYSRLLKEVALTGSWTTTDEGKKTTPPTGYKGTDPDGKQQVYNSLKPGKDELKYDVDKPDTGDRNLASQVVQMTLINAMYELGHMNKVDSKDGKIIEDKTAYRYVMGPNRTVTEFTPQGQVTMDIGEDLLMNNGKPVLGKDGKPTKGGPDMVQENVLRTALMMFNETPTHIESTGYYDDPQKGRVYKNDLPDKQKFLDWKKDGKMPILTPTMGGAHAQTIHDCWEDPASGKLWVLLDNQHGEPEVKGKARKSGEGDGDGWITLDQLHSTIKQAAQGPGFGQPVMPVVNKYSHPSKLANK